MLSLVAYDCSDDEDVDDNQEENQIKSLTEDKITIEDNSKEESTSTDSSSLFSKLPPPISTTTSIITEDMPFEDHNAKSNKQRKPVKITIPALSSYEEEPEDEHPKKPLTTAQKKATGLFDILPAPRSAIVNSNLKIIPQHVKRLQPSTSKKADLPKTVVRTVDQTADSDDESDMKEGVDFFSGLSSSATSSSISEDPIALKPTSVDLARDVDPVKPKRDNKFFSTLFAETKREQSPEPYDERAEWDKLPLPGSEEEQELKKKQNELEQEELVTLCGAAAAKKKRKGKRGEPIEVIEVNAADLNSEAQINVSRGLTDPLQAQENNISEKDGPGGMHKRKHQITYLAHQAKVREQELKNQWALNRFSRAQTRAKYGF